MSRLWPERVVAHLSPSGLGVLHRGGRGAPLPVQEFEAEPPGAGEPSWGPAVRLLADTVNAGAFRHALLEIVVSNHFARFVVAPGSAALRGAEDERAHAQQCFFDMHGEGRGWRLRSAGRDPRRNRLVTGLEAPLADAIGAAVRPLGWRGRRVQPLLSMAFDRACWRVGRRSAWLACVEPDLVCLARVDRGQWLSVRSEDCAPTWREALPALLERAELVAEADGEARDVLVLAAPDAHRVGGEFGRWHLEYLC